MSLEEIKAAVCSGRRVFWVNENYEVVFDAIGQWFIKCHINGHYIGLTWDDEVTLNGKPEEFYCAE
jgi:predicted HNH restriction endonuclease